MISVIIPAHNEEAVMSRGLEYLLAGAEPRELEVIVACNGCTDRTAEIARSFGAPVQVLEIRQASKTAALNAAEELATAFPRVYMDADVRLNIDSVRRMAVALEPPSALLAAPKLRMDLSQTSWFVRAYYEVWTCLPYNQTMVGTGVYALSRAGRARFDRFPDVIADDGFVRFHFRPEERQSVDGAEVRVDPPRTSGGLIRIKTRAKLGQLQLRQRFPSLRGADHKTLGPILRVLMSRPRLWLNLPVYFALNLAMRFQARRCLVKGVLRVWERDDSRKRALSHGGTEVDPERGTDCRSQHPTTVAFKGHVGSS